MSDRNFSRRRRGMRFRPTGGLGHGQQPTDRDALQARAEAVGGGVARTVRLFVGDGRTTVREGNRAEEFTL